MARRRLFTVLSILSLILFLVTAVLWVRSYWVLDRFQRFSYVPESGGVRRTEFRIDSAGGGVAVTVRIDHNHEPAILSARGRTFDWGSSWSWDAEPDVAYPTPRWWGGPSNLVRYWWRGGFGRPFSPGSRSWYVGVSPKLRSGFFGWRVAGARVDHWPLAVLTAILPLAWLVAYRRRRSRAPGACEHCGYNLTGNTSGTCPECGTPTTAGVKARHGGDSI